MIILLAGHKGSGKTTVAMNLAVKLTHADIQVGGVICPGIFEQNIKSRHQKPLSCNRP
jgi:nucleoside-triphosphatase THEP1